MQPDINELDKWKDFVLKVLIERGGATLTDYIWNRLKSEFNVSNDNLAHYRYTDCVLPCLEDEFQLISTSGDRGIQITEKGKQVAKRGYRSYIDSLYRHELIQRINDYLGISTAFLSILSTMFSFVNLHFEWMDKWGSFISSALLVVLFIAFRLLSKSK